MSNHPKVTDQLMYNRISGSVPAVTSEQIFGTVNANTFSYSGQQEMILKLSTGTENAFLDARHSFIRMKVKNTSTVPIYFDTLASSIIRRLQIQAGGITIENMDHYNALMNILLEHWSSQEFNNEMKILSSFPNASKLADGTYDFTNTAGVNYGMNQILPNDTKTICIPLISSFMNSKLLPLCFLANSFLELHLFLEDPRVAFLTQATKKTVNGTDIAGSTNAEASAVNYEVSNVEMVCNIISIRDNSLVSALGQMLLSDGLHICGKTWTCYNNVMEAGAKSNYTFTINDRSQSMCYIINGMYVAQPDSRVSNLSSGVFGSTAFRYQVGSEYYPRAKAITYNSKSIDDSFISPYLQLQRVSSNGFFSTNNKTSVDFNSYSCQNPNTLLDFGASPVAFDGTCVNSVRPSSFCQAYSFCSFDNMTSAEVGLNTALLSLPLTLNIDRDITTYYGGKKADGSDYKKNTDGTVVNAPSIPMLNLYSWVCSDIIWKLNSSGMFETLK